MGDASLSTSSRAPPSPNSLSPARSPPSASSLPVDVLAIIFAHAVNIPLGVTPHGGYLDSWQTNETLSGLALVCRGWVEAATNILYRSVFLSSRQSTDLFLRTLADSPFLPGKVIFLVLGFSGNEASPPFPETAQDSLVLLEALRRCAGNVTHLHLHRLHLQTQPQLLETLSRTSSLETLICSPDFTNSERDDQMSGSLASNSTTEATSIRNGRPPNAGAVRFRLPSSLRCLELDFESTWNADLLPFHEALSNSRRLKRLRLRCDTAEAALLREMLEQCASLEVCELYFEQLLPRTGTAAALRPSARSMKHMLFITNPTIDKLVHVDLTATPIFDQLLPAYTSLETLSVSSTEVSSSVMRLVPSSLQALEIQAFNHQSTFVYTPQLAADLRNPTLATGLKSLRIHDAAEAWEEADIAVLRRACAERGIDFHFKLDSDVASHRED
ncbi:hypothetical protein JCM11251_005978 [Rhodosporidiobolus azoricus]